MGADKLDVYGDLAPDDKGKKKKGMSLFKTLLLCFLSVLVIFVIWLFYPVKPPRRAIRDFLPADCMVSFEVHSPSDLWKNFEQKKILDRFKKLPVWEIIREGLKKDGVDADRDLERFRNHAIMATEAVVGFRNVTAFAFGVSTDSSNPKGSVSVIFETDNIGVLGIKAGLLFLDSAIYDGHTFYIIPRKLSKVDMDFYVSAIPGTRRFVVVSDKDLFGKFRFNAKKNIKSRYVDNIQTAVEMNVNVDESVNLAAFAPRGMVLPKSNRMQINAYLDMDVFSADIRAEISDAGYWKQDKSGKRLALLEMPPKTKGLFMNSSMPRDYARGPLMTAGILELLRASGMNSQEAAVAMKSFENGVLKYFAGNMFAGIFEPEGENEIPLACWTVENPSAAWAAFDRQARFELKKVVDKESDYLRKKLLEQITIKREKSRSSLSMPVGSTVNWRFGKEKGYGYGSVFMRDTPLMPSLVDQPAGVEAAGGLKWLYSEKVEKAMKETALMMQVMKFMSGDDKTISDMDKTFKVIAAILGSMDKLEIKQQLKRDLVKGTMIMESKIYGKLRLPEN